MSTLAGVTHMKTLRTVGPLAVALAVSAGCSTDLDVVNPNNPDVDRALATPADVRNLAASSLRSWYYTSQFLHPYTMLSVTADVHTANFGNFGMRFNNVEPRIPYENNSAGGDRGATEDPWEFNYATVGAANDAIRAIDAGIVLPGGAAETNQYKALAQFVQAGVHTNLALLFDRAFIVDETYNPSDPAAARPALVPYPQVAAAAKAQWDRVIAALQPQTATFPAATIPLTVGDLTTQRLYRIANTMAARLLAYTPRTPAAAQQVDWAAVLQYAERGISGSGGAAFDVSVVGDGSCFNVSPVWCSQWHAYANEQTWMRVDVRLINLMDPTVPAKYDGTNVGPSATADARLLGSTSDFEYHGAAIGDPGRGIYMMSPYSYRRYRHYARTSATRFTGPAPMLLATENDLLIAEALVRTGGDLNRAAELINRTRVTRGQRTPATAADAPATLLQYIDYERQVELFSTSAPEIYDARRFGRLQAGTVRHLPIPAKELETLGEPIYTFGGTTGPDMYVGAPGGEIMPLRFPRTRSVTGDVFRLR